MHKLLTFVFVLLCALSFAQKKNKTILKYANTITATDLKTHLYIVAGKEMEGRETATEGQRKAAAYIEKQFKNLGLLPGAKDGYQQPFPVYMDSLVTSGIEINGKAFNMYEDFLPSNANYNASLRIGEVVFVGYGQKDTINNDYKGLDVRGKVVMLFSSNPSGTGKSQSLQSRIEAATKEGAIALLLIQQTGFPRKAPVSGRGNMYIRSFANTIRPLTFTISEKVAEAIMGTEYTTAKNGMEKNDIKKKNYFTQMIITFNKSIQVLQSTNVLGLLEGTDLKDEYVFITAHYDHLGKRDTTIYYGADDDGSGTVSVLEMAEAFAKAKAEGKGPRRSIVFMAVSGEEKGLWGSEYYTNHPLYPLEKTTVDLNIDMVGRIGQEYSKGPNKDSLNYIYVIGDDKLSSDLKPISENNNNVYTNLKLDYKYNDLNDPNRFYYRSDHYNFAEKGVPIIFYFDGVHKDYHRPTDTPDKIEYDLMTKRVQLIFYTAWEMANRDAMLKRDIPLQ